MSALKKPAAAGKSANKARSVAEPTSHPSSPLQEGSGPEPDHNLFGHPSDPLRAQLEGSEQRLLALEGGAPSQNEPPPPNSKRAAAQQGDRLLF